MTWRQTLKEITSRSVERDWVFVIHRKAISNITPSTKIVAKLLVALNESSEWSQITILDFLVTYKNI